MTLGLSVINPATIPLLALGTVTTASLLNESDRLSRLSKLEHYEQECLNRNPNATKREAFTYALARIGEEEEKEEAKRRVEELRRQEEERQSDWECPNACSPDLDY